MSDDPDNIPEDFDYAGLEKDLEELEAQEPAVRAARDQYEAVRRGIIENAPRPDLLAIDAKGYCWRVFDDGTWSMARINPDNSPIPQPVTFYVPKDEAKGAREDARPFLEAVAYGMTDSKSLTEGAQAILDKWRDAPGDARD